jgi:tetratricopeptide (TPR) repeat protein
MPQHAKRVKIRRKDLRLPDEFETLTGRALDWVRERQGLVGAVVGVLVLVALGMLVVSRWRASQNEAAALDFRMAHETFEAGKFPEAATAFAEIAEEYPRTPTGRLSRLYRAHALARKGDQAEAAVAYTEYLASAVASDYLQQEAYTNLGRANEATGDTAGALEAYSKASELDGPFKHDALLGAARMHEAAGRADEARPLYAQVLKDTEDADIRAFLLSKVPESVAEAPKEDTPEEDTAAD